MKFCILVPASAMVGAVLAWEQKLDIRGFTAQSFRLVSCSIPYTTGARASGMLAINLLSQDGANLTPSKLVYNSFPVCTINYSYLLFLDLFSIAAPSHCTMRWRMLW